MCRQIDRTTSPLLYPWIFGPLFSFLSPSSWSFLEAIFASRTTTFTIQPCAPRTISPRPEPLPCSSCSAGLVSTYQTVFDGLSVLVNLSRLSKFLKEVAELWVYTSILEDLPCTGVQGHKC